MPYPEFVLALTPEQLALLGAVLALLVGLLAAPLKHRQLLRLRREHLAGAGQHQAALETIQQTLTALATEVAAGREDLNPGLRAWRETPAGGQKPRRTWRPAPSCRECADRAARPSVPTRASARGR